MKFIMSLIQGLLCWNNLIGWFPSRCAASGEHTLFRRRSTVIRSMVGKQHETDALDRQFTPRSFHRFVSVTLSTK